MDIIAPKDPCGLDFCDVIMLDADDDKFYLFMNELMQKNKIYREKIWNIYVGEEVGIYPCFLCDNKISKINFNCIYDNKKIKDDNIVNMFHNAEDVLPVCHKCYTKKKKEEKDDIFHSNTNKILFNLNKKIEMIKNNCILDKELYNEDVNKIIRYIATTPILWNQFISFYLSNKNKIRIGKFHKQIVIYL